MHRYDPDTLSNATNMDYLLTTLTIVPCALGVLLETPLFDVITARDRRARWLEKSQPGRLSLRRKPSQSVSCRTQPGGRGPCSGGSRKSSSER